MGMDTRRATVGFRMCARPYVEEADRAQRSRHARIRSGSSNPVRNAGKKFQKPDGTAERR